MRHCSSSLVRSSNAAATVVRACTSSPNTQMINELQVIHRGGTTTDIVRALDLLRSEEARFINEQTLQMSGAFPLYI